jgi:hypothetical protein
MNDTTKALRAYIYSALNDNITYNSALVPIVNKASDDTDYPYISVYGFNFVDDGTKDKFGGVHQVNVAINTRFSINLGGQDAGDDISNLVLQTLRVRNATSDFGSDSMFIFKLTSTRSVDEEDDQYWYYTKILVFEATVIED